jgi:hypothetical protein
MKNFKIKTYQLLIAFFLLIVSCQDNGDTELLFEDTPTVRVAKTIKELKESLQKSENGWKITYFTDNTQLGGFTFLFDFTSDSEVKMDSDFGTPDANKTSLYDVTLGSTVKLSFTTKNVIHELSDGGNFPDAALRGQGYKGSFEFLYFKKEGEDILFKSNRDRGNIIRFKKATKEDWANLAKNKNIEAKIKNDAAKFKSFRYLEVGKKIYKFTYNAARRFSTSENLNEEKSTIKFGIGFSPTDIIINPAIDVDGSKVTNFTYNTTSDKFVAKVNDKEVASIYYAKDSKIPYVFGKEAGNIRLLRTNPAFLPRDMSSVPFVTFFEGWRTSFQTATSFPIVRVYIRGLDTPKPFVDIYIINGGNRAQFPCTYKVTDSPTGKVVKFSETITPGEVTNPFRLREQLEPMINFIFREKGFHIKRLENLNVFGQNTIGLTPVDAPNMLSQWYDF